MGKGLVHYPHAQCSGGEESGQDEGMCQASGVLILCSTGDPAMLERTRVGLAIVLGKAGSKVGRHR